MEFDILMHKQIPVAEIKISGKTAEITKIGNVFAPEHLPVGVGILRGKPIRKELNEWWVERSIPVTRSGVDNALEILKISKPQELLPYSLGLSLSDQYWVSPAETDMKWENVNYFTNKFSEDIGDILFDRAPKDKKLDFSSPDCTSDGNLKKRWKIINGTRCLIKGGSYPFRQEPFNEMVASELMRLLGIPHVRYDVVWDNGVPYSVCEDFINENTELVPAWRIIQTKKRKNDVSLYQHFIDCSKELGIPDVIPFLDRMIGLDFIIANEDRHLNNFGALRNPNTLEWLGMAPIYDSGSSLGYTKKEDQLFSEADTNCKPFKACHSEQIRLVQTRDWLDFGKTEQVEEMILSLLSKEETVRFLSKERIHSIARSTAHRIDLLKQII